MRKIINKILVILGIKKETKETQNGFWAAVPALAGLAGGIIQGIRNNKDKRQLKQQRALGELQMEQDKAMGIWNNQQQLEMWKKTGPEGQVEQYNKAGLNPGLMYGMGGGGGQTVGATGVGGVQGASAPVGGNEESIIGMGVQSIAQLALLKAQKENIESQTDLNKVEAAKKAGVDTDNVVAGTENTKAHTEYQKVLNSIQNKTQEEQAEAIRQTTLKLTGEAESAVAQGNVDTKTQNLQISTIQQGAINAYLQAGAIKAGTALANQSRETQVKEIQIKLEELKQKWQALSNEQRKIEIDKLFKEGLIETQNRAIDMKIIGDLIGTAVSLGTKM